MRGSLILATLLLGAQGPEAAIVGTIRNADTGAPVADAVVALIDLDRAVRADSLGRYVIRDVPPGPQHVTVRRLGFLPRTLHALVPARGEVEINVLLQPQAVVLREVEVRPPVALRGAEEGHLVASPDREASTAAIRNHPLSAEPDVLQALGGGEVVIGQETPSGVQLRGGATSETGYLLDGIPVFSPYHSAGTFSAWSPDVIERVTVRVASDEPGAPHVLSGTIAGVTRKPGSQLGAQGSVGTSQARMSLDGPLGKGGAGYLFSARASFPGFVDPDREPSYLGGDAGDVLGKLETPILGGQLQLLGYLSDNEISAVAVEEGDGWDPAGPPRNEFIWNSQSFGAHWSRAVAAARITVVAWDALGSASAGWHPDSATVIRMASRRRDRGLGAGVEYAAARSVTRLAVRAQHSVTDYEAADDGESSAVAFHARIPVASAILGHTRRLAGSLLFDAGLEGLRVGSRAYASPRVELRWSVSHPVVLSGTLARARQFAQSLRNPESVIGSIFPADLYAGSRGEAGDGVPVARADHGILGVEYRPRAGARFGAQAYARRSRGLLLVAPRTGDPFATDGFTTGTGRVHGVSFDAAFARPRYGFVLAYGWQRVRLTYSDSSYAPAGAGEHLVETGIILFPSLTSSVRIGIAGAKGRRATAVLGSLDWESCNVLDRGCELAGSPRHATDELGATKLPAYLRLDLGLRKHWHVRIAQRDVTIGAFGVVTNVLGRGNVFTVARRTATAEQTSILMRPRAPLVVGLDWRF